MRNRRVAQVFTSDDEDEVPMTRRRSRSEDKRPERKRKKMKLQDEDDEEDDEQTESKKRKKKQDEEEEEEPEEEGNQEDAKPIGEVVRVSGKGRGRRSYYESFEFDGNRYDLVSSYLHLGSFSRLYLLE